MRRRSSMGRMSRAAAWILVLGALYTFMPASALAESRSGTAYVDFISGSTTRPVSPVDPDRPERELPIERDRPELEIPINPALPKSETPTNPEQPVPGPDSDGEPDPTGESGTVAQVPGATGAAGWLAINYVTPLHYVREMEAGTYTVEQEQRPYLQTSDLRGTATGWKVTAIAGPFHDPGTLSPTPALLRFCHGVPNSTHASFRPPGIPEQIELPANGKTQRLIALAEAGEGVGVWVARWYPENGAAQDFQLRLFSPTSIGKLGYVLWVMNDAP